MCTYSERFFTSRRVTNKSEAFEVNRRVMLATRNIGVGHQGLVKFSAAMNMLAPMNANAYRDHVKAIHEAAEVVAKASMANAAEETKQSYEPEVDGVYDIEDFHLLMELPEEMSGKNLSERWPKYWWQG